MATSTLRIYVTRVASRLWKLKPEKLFQLDNIEAYLKTLNNANSDYIETEFQYFKFELRKTIKVQLNQQYVSPIIYGNPVYVRVQNSDMGSASFVYYFVQNFEWRSQNCIELELVCDVLNTFKGLYTFNDKTMVIREHRDRYAPFERNIIDTDLPDYFELNTYYQLKKQTQACATVPTDNTKTKVIKVSSINPLTITNEYALGSFEIQEVSTNVFHFVGDSVTITDTQLNSGNYFIISSDQDDIDNLQYYCEFKGFLKSISLWRYAIDKVSENINPILYAREKNYDLQESSDTTIKWYLVYITVGNLDDNTGVNCFLYPSDTDNYDFGENSYAMAGINDTTNGVDKTDPKVIKIIECPYCPVSRFEELTPDWEATGTGTYLAYKLKNLDTKLEAKIPFEKYYDSKDSIFKVLSQDLSSNLSGITATTSNLEIEPKLFHSEFFIPKFIYDSFTLPIICENLDLEYLCQLEASNILDDSVTYYTASTINSRFAFKINAYYEKYRENDYPEYLVASRNNEVVIYNSPYLNYIRTGYNYDVKNKNVSNAMTWLGVGASLIGTVASGVAAAGTGGIAIPLALGMATSTAMTLTNAINTTAQNERNMEQRLTQLKNQSASIIGSDDLDILNVYNGNKLLYNIYKPTEVMEELIKKLFFYTGYATQRMGTPNETGRLHFNFVQCEPVLNYYLAYHLPKEFKDELENIMRTGYTILHNTGTNDSPVYDFEQQYENIETSVYNYFNGGE